MWVIPAVVALVIAAQVVETSGCSSDSPTQTPPAGSSSGGSSSPSEAFQTQDGVRFGAETVIANLDIPWSMAFAPDGRLFITERPGRVRIFNLSNATNELALTLSDTFAQGEAGLLGLALDPDFAQTRHVYLYYTTSVAGSPMNQVVRYREVGGRLGERAVLLDRIPAGTIHDGGRLRFGPDGLLYITAGDAGTANLAQDLGSLAGKILRLNRDGSAPRTNPFASPVFSLGHRNPQGIDWHPTTGDLWESEHGNVGNDEINVLQAGLNFGWPRIEANQSGTGMETPVTFFAPAIAPSGASFYRGTRIPQFTNNLFVASLRGTHLLRIRIDPGSPRRIAAQERLLDGRFGRLRDVASGPDGFLYVLTNNRDGRGSPDAQDDRLIRLVPAN